MAFPCTLLALLEHYIDRVHVCVCVRCAARECESHGGFPPPRTLQIRERLSPLFFNPHSNKSSGHGARSVQAPTALGAGKSCAQTHTQSSYFVSSHFLSAGSNFDVISLTFDHTACSLCRLFFFYPLLCPLVCVCVCVLAPQRCAICSGCEKTTSSEVSAFAAKNKKKKEKSVGVTFSR